MNKFKDKRHNHYNYNHIIYLIGLNGLIKLCLNEHLINKSKQNTPINSNPNYFELKYTFG